jgi:hypothetical protein
MVHGRGGYISTRMWGGVGWGELLVLRSCSDFGNAAYSAVRKERHAGEQ